MGHLPLGDWQFYIVTAAMLGAMWLIVRPLLPRKDGSTGCPHCADGMASKKRPRKTEMTIMGKRI